MPRQPPVGSGTLRHSRFLELSSPLWLDFRLLQAFRRTCPRHNSDECTAGTVTLRRSLAGSPSSPVKVSHSPLQASGPPSSGSRIPPLRASSASPGIPGSLSGPRLAPSPFASASRLVKPISTQGRLGPRQAPNLPFGQGNHPDPVDQTMDNSFQQPRRGLFSSQHKEKLEVQ